ncbi:hypothetical protein DAEQUDRAFT_731233 [Daedalea quercina L-15889]|uniref:F-box domain-containing protein n=1 Tax=Daedalea quercina L-15889 TaxID=1314783 RepID=A0A165MDQ8_9APHY|nr:hypothetical protein DAEQUDRAFT_731233 [Daedalea quercina L-15889]
MCPQTQPNMSSTSHLELPLELLEYTVDYLHDDVHALRTCSLTCQSLLPVTRLHLFRCIILRRVPDCLRFLDALETSAHTHARIADYVKDLRTPFMALVSRGERKGWRFELLRRILRDLHHLGSLRLYAFDWMGFMDLLYVDASVGSLRGVMAAFFPFPELKELLIDNLVSRSHHELTLLISLFPRLSRLELQWTFMSRTTEPLPEPSYDVNDFQSIGRLATHMQTLVADFGCGSDLMVAGIVETLLSPPFHVCFSQIEWETTPAGLRRANRDDTQLLNEVLRSSEHKLESLKVTFGEDSWLEDLELSRYKRLTNLSFTFRNDDEGLFLPHLPGLVSGIASQRLQEVHFHIEADGDEVPWDFVDWPSLDRALASLHKRCPSITLTFHFYGLLLLGQAKPDIVKPLKERIIQTLQVGMRVAAVLSAMVYGPPEDSDQPLNMTLKIEPDEHHWVNVET